MLGWFSSYLSLPSYMTHEINSTLCKTFSPSLFFISLFSVSKLDFNKYWKCSRFVYLLSVFSCPLISLLKLKFTWIWIETKSERKQWRFLLRIFTDDSWASKRLFSKEYFSSFVISFIRKNISQSVSAKIKLISLSWISKEFFYRSIT